MDKTVHRLMPAFADHNIPVILSINNLFVPYAGVFIQSLLDHASAKKNYDVIILERDISTPNKQLLKQFDQGHTNLSIRFYDPSHILESVDISTMETQHYPVEVYYKILAPYIFRNYPRLIVTDVDALLKRDIAELYEADLGDHCLGAVLDVTREGNYQRNYTMLNKVALRDYYRDTLIMKEPCRYVNSGVLVFDVEKYCGYLDIQTIFDTASSKDFLLPDQDALNLLFEGQIEFIDMAWNVQVTTNKRTECAIELASEATREVYQRARASPALLHWNGKPKPWVCPDVLLGYEWWSVAVRTPFLGHITVRMLDALETRRQYYMERYGAAVNVWDPEPEGVWRN